MGKDALSRSRRRHVRGRLRAVADLTYPGRRLAGPYHVENLSAGGALLRGIPTPGVKTAVEVRLHLPDLAPIHIAGVVLRREESTAGDACFAIAFRDVFQDIEDAIQGSVLKALEDSSDLETPAVLIVGTSPVDRGGLARDIGSLGCRVTEAATALDAVRRLQDRRRSPDVVLARLEFLLVNGTGFLGFVKGEFPGVRRVLVTREAYAEQAGAVLSTHAAHSVLFEPWDRQHLAAAVGLSEGRA